MKFVALWVWCVALTLKCHLFGWLKLLLRRCKFVAKPRILLTKSFHLKQIFENLLLYITRLEFITWNTLLEIPCKKGLLKCIRNTGGSLFRVFSEVKNWEKTSVFYSSTPHDETCEIFYAHIVVIKYWLKQNTSVHRPNAVSNK